MTSKRIVSLASALACASVIQGLSDTASAQTAAPYVPADPFGNTPAPAPDPAPDASAGKPTEPAPDDQEAHTTAQARMLYEEGAAAADAGDWVVAADRFRRAQALRPSPATSFNLAVALERIGKLIEASEQLHTTLRDEDTPPPVREASEALLARIQLRLAKLTIQVSGSTEGVVLRLNEEPLAAEQIGVAMPVNPGAHEVAAWRVEQRIAAGSVEVAEGAAASIALHLPAPTPPAVTVSPPKPIEASGDTNVFETWWFWTTVGVAVVGITAVAVAVSADDSGGASTSMPVRLEFGR